MTQLRDQIIDILKDVYYNNDQADPFEEEYVDLIIDLFEKRIDELLDKSSKYEWVNALTQLKEMLQKK